jgi:hypothetical protein
MYVELYRSPRVTVGSPAHNAERAKAEHLTQQERIAGRGSVTRWDDEYNDYSARGTFVVTGRR